MSPGETGAAPAGAAEARPRLARLAAAGETVVAAANAPVDIDDPSSAWFVSRGALDVFVFEKAGDEIVSSAVHLLRAPQGRLVFPLALPERLSEPFAVVAKGLPDTELRRLRADDLAATDLAAEVAEQADLWVAQLARTVSSRIEVRPRPTRLLDAPEARQPWTVPAGSVLSTRAGAVAWIDASGGEIAYLGTEVPSAGGLGAMPLTADSWATVSGEMRLDAQSSRGLAEEGRLFEAVRGFHSLALGAEQLNRTLGLADAVNEQTARAAHRRQARESARRGLASLVGAADPAAADGGESGLLAVLAPIGRRSGIKFRGPADRGPAVREPTLEEILAATGVRSRPVRLEPDHRWWASDSGALLARLEDSGEPVALIPGWIGRYRMVDAAGRSSAVTAATAARLSGQARCFYTPLPSERPATARDVLRLARLGAGADLARFMAAGLVAAAVAQAPAIALGALADWVLPLGAEGALVQVLSALALFTLLGMVLAMLQGVTLMRLDGRVGSRLSAAAWDRLLALPLPFFRNTVSGELAVRMGSFQVMRGLLSGVVAGTLVSVAFLVPTLTILFLYDTALALVAVATAAVALTVIAGAGLLQIPAQRDWYAASRRLSGQLFQFINSMTKIRAAGAESSAFAAWSGAYRDKQLADIRISRFSEHVAAFGAALPFGFTAVLCAVSLARGDELSVGDFLVVFAVATTFYAAVAGLGHSVDAVASMLTAYEQIRSVLEAVPERDPATAQPVELGGELLLDHLSFRYAEGGPLIVDDVTVGARPGEFIAIVGGSGAGKSTLMRLALGLEEPASGGVYFDGRDLKNLDHRAVRRQVGVVPQSSSLQPGSLLDNIVGMAGDLTIDDAWRAARLAAVDADIAEMPMQMLTMVGDRATTFSGGQVQRIRIAAALVRDPRIVFLDEATSWLDGRSQAQVMRGIENLSATRVVIAHRLSTIRRADRIYVLEQGRVVQEGAFDDLYSAEGPFRELVRRQQV